MAKVTFVASEKDEKGNVKRTETREVVIRDLKTLEDLKALPGYSEEVLCKTVQKQLTYHVAQGRIKKLILEGKCVDGQEFGLAFPTGERVASGEKELKDGYKKWESVIRGLSVKDKNELHKKLMERYPEADAPAWAEDDCTFLRAYHQRELDREAFKNATTL